ncbi:MAG: hypothetical protein II225_02665, partial [Ruminococcus sp.]|nr:hypothetical protein [Ruminococcus sp.]
MVSMVVASVVPAWASEHSVSKNSDATKIGDVDMNGHISIKDATLIQKFLTSLVDLSDYQLCVADADNSGDVNVKDVTMIQKILAGVIDEFTSINKDNKEENEDITPDETVTEAPTENNVIRKLSPEMVEAIKEYTYLSINDERTKCGVETLGYDQHLSDAAQIRSYDYIAFGPDEKSSDYGVDQNIYDWSVISHHTRDFYIDEDFDGSEEQVKGIGEYVASCIVNYWGVDFRFEDMGIGVSYEWDYDADALNVVVSMVFANKSYDTEETVTDPAEEYSTEMSTEVPTEEPTEVSTERPTESTTELVDPTEPDVTEGPTEKPTKVPTEIPTEPEPTEPIIPNIETYGPIDPIEGDIVTAEMLWKIEEEFFRLVNEERVRVGVKPLTYNKHLDDIAQIRSVEIIELYSHTRPNGEMFWEMIDTDKYNWCRMGENICYFYH